MHVCLVVALMSRCSQGNFTDFISSVDAACSIITNTSNSKWNKRASIGWSALIEAGQRGQSLSFPPSSAVISSHPHVCFRYQPHKVAQCTASHTHAHFDTLFVALHVKLSLLPRASGDKQAGELTLGRSQPAKIALNPPNSELRLSFPDSPPVETSISLPSCLATDQYGLFWAS